jgi:hypothetical protein
MRIIPWGTPACVEITYRKQTLKATIRNAAIEILVGMITAISLLLL